MRVALKLMVVFVGLLVTVLAFEGWLRLRREREVYERDAEHEQRLLGRALRPSVELAWRARGIGAARAVLQRAQEGESEVGIRLVALEEGAEGGEPALTVQWRQDAEDATVVDRASSPGAMYTYVPVDGPDGPGTAIELSESLAKPEARLHRSASRVAWTALAIVFGAALLAVVFGEWFVGRPVRKMMSHTSRIGQGDLSPLQPARRRDELGQLKHAIAGMVQGLAEANEEAERATEARLEAERRLRQGERLAAVGTLAAGVAHELGTPLQVVAGRARMIEQDPALGDSARRHATIIAKQAQHMERIVRELLGLARQDAAIEEDDVCMADVARETLELLGPSAERDQVELTLIEAAPGHIRGDREHLAQLLTNLVQNAIQAMPDGGEVRVRVGDAADVEPPPGEPSRVADRYVCISITDEGPGISPELQSQVFDPFFTTKDVGEGTGLGLPVAYGIAREHGGWIELDSEPGVGSVFRVLLPAERPT